MTQSKVSIQALCDNGLLGQETVDKVNKARCVRQQQVSPWYLSLLLALCGWLSAWFALALLSLLWVGLFDSSIALIIVGSALIVAAYFVLADVANTQNSNNSEFLQHLGLAISSAGQIMIVAALFFVSGLFESAPHTSVNNGIFINNMAFFQWLILFAMQSTLAFIMPNTIHRFGSAYVATLSFVMLLQQIYVFDFFLAELASPLLIFTVGLLWLYEYPLSAFVKGSKVIAYGITLLLLQMNVAQLYFKFHGDFEYAFTVFNHPIISETLNLLAVLFVLIKLIKQQPSLLNMAHKMIGLTIGMLLCVLTFFAPGLAFSVLIMLIAFANRAPFLLAMGVISALFNLSGFYYFLDISLFHKSLLLVAMGASAIGIYWLSALLDKAEQAKGSIV